jgi:hypothetical protein
MGVTFCKCKLRVFLYIPCLHKLKDDRFISSHPQPDKVVSLEEKPPDEGANCEKEPVILKSSLKKDVCPDSNGVEIEKRNVKWMDFVGKDLVEVREFDPM